MINSHKHSELGEAWRPRSPDVIREETKTKKKEGSPAAPPASPPSAVQHPATETFLETKRKKSAVSQNLSKPESEGSIYSAGLGCGE